MIKKLFLTESGFTLVELAIVMIIIGLLIGGILKGQELVESARVTATAAQIKGYGAAINTFRDKYNALPGDMINPSVRIPNCTAAACNTPGDGDGILGKVEGYHTAPQLAAADMITGFSPDGTVGVPIGATLHALEAKISGNQLLPQNMSAPTDGGCAAAVIAGPVFRYGLYIGMDFPGCTPGITPSEAYRIDAKLDDGAPGTGDVLAWASAGALANCGDIASYKESSSVVSCMLFIRVSP